MGSDSLELIFSTNPLWQEVKEVLWKLHQAGWEAVLAGGAVRDSLLGKPPKDFDVAVSAPPEEVLKLFPRGKDLWKRYGVVFLPLSERGKNLEITTFRKDRSYTDGRRPDEVAYTSLKEDALRRDFTVNALFYDVKNSQILDFVKGEKDLKEGWIRTVGQPKQRFEEDKLRPLRALRFVHQLGFVLEEETKKAVTSCSKDLRFISKERIYDELMKMFSSGKYDKAITLLKDHSFFDSLFPFPRKPLRNPFLFWRRTFSFNQEPAFVWAVLGLPYFYNYPAEFPLFLEANFKVPVRVSKKSVRYVASVATLFSKESFIEKMKAFALGKQQVLELARNFSQAFHPKSLEMLEELYREFQERETSQGELPKALLSGEDLLKSGYTAGPELGKLLKKAFAFQIEKKISSQQELLTYLKKL